MMRFEAFPCPQEPLFKEFQRYASKASQRYQPPSSGIALKMDILKGRIGNVQGRQSSNKSCICRPVQQSTARAHPDCHHFCADLCLCRQGQRSGSNGRSPASGIKLNLPALVFGDEFGHSIAIDGDTLVASAWRTDVGNAKQQGVVYIFERDAGDPLLFNLSKTLTASDGHEFHGFGSAVAISGNTIVAGAEYDSDNGHFQAGAVYVFERNHGGANAWGEVKKLVDANFNDQFSEHGYMGDAVAIHGDTIVAGAPKKGAKSLSLNETRMATSSGVRHRKSQRPTIGRGAALAWR